MKSIVFSDSEQTSIKHFCEDHKNCIFYREVYPWYIRIFKRLLRKSIYKSSSKPPHFQYIVSPTCIGYGVSVRCNYCGTEIDITDYSVW